MAKREELEVGDKVQILISPEGRARDLFASVEEKEDIKCRIVIHSKEYPWKDGEEKWLPYSLVRKVDSE